MKRETHPEAYDWQLLCGRTKEQIEGAFDELVIGIWEAHADLRAAGKLPASAYAYKESTEDDETGEVQPRRKTRKK